MAIDPICGMEVDESTDLKVDYEGQTCYFCGPGCREKFLIEKGVITPPQNRVLSSSNHVEEESQLAKTKISVTGMHCASCPLNIEDSLKKMAGVSKASVNFGNEKAYVEYNPREITAVEFEDAIVKAGYGILKEKPRILNLRVIGMDNSRCLGIVEGALKTAKGIINQQLFLK